MRAALWIIAALLLTSSSAIAEEQRAVAIEDRWEVDIRAARVVLGGQTTTGGFMPQLAGRRVWAVAPWADVSVGAELGAFGFGDESRWVGVLGGATLGASVRPIAPLALGLTVDVAAGRIPVCNDWGLCLRYIGLFPAATLDVSYYTARHVAIRGSLAARYVDTLAWTGASVEPSIGGVVYW